MQSPHFDQSQAVIKVLRALVDHFADRPHVIPGYTGDEDAVRAAVSYVAGMTDRYAFRTAVALLDWDPAELPRAV